MIGVIIKFLITILIYLAWVYAGGTQQESLFISLVFLAILLLRPIPFQSAEERNEVLEKMLKNQERIKELQKLKKDEKKQIDQDSLNRAAYRARKEEKKKKEGSSQE